MITALCDCPTAPPLPHVADAKASPPNPKAPIFRKLRRETPSQKPQPAAVDSKHFNSPADVETKRAYPFMAEIAPLWQSCNSAI